MDGTTTRSLRARLTSHCLLLEMDHGLALVDTGYGLRDVRDPRSRLAKPFLAMLRPELREEMTALRQIERLGFAARDVRDILLSHLDFDHAGGLDDFPQATVHMLADEISSASAQLTVLDRMRYRPQQWSLRANWRSYSSYGGEVWRGFDKVHQVGLGPDVLLVPLIGHTLGHAGIAVRREDGWLLYAADAYFYHAEMSVARPHCTPGLELYQTLMEKDRGSRLRNQQRLRELVRAHGDGVRVFCAHDVREFEQLAGRTHREPIRARAPAPASSESLRGSST